MACIHHVCESSKCSNCTFTRKAEGAEWSEEPITVTMTQYQYDGSGIVEPAYQHVFIILPMVGPQNNLLKGNYNHYGSLAWSQDSQKIFSHHIDLMIGN